MSLRQSNSTYNPLYLILFLKNLRYFSPECFGNNYILLTAGVQIHGLRGGVRSPLARENVNTFPREKLFAPLLYGYFRKLLCLRDSTGREERSKFN